MVTPATLSQVRFCLRGSDLWGQSSRGMVVVVIGVVGGLVWEGGRKGINTEK